MASIEMETLKAGMKMMMEKGFAPKFDGKMDPVNLRNIVQSAQERMPSEPGRDVYTLDYRLCPENPYPAPLDDTYSFYTGVVAENPDTPIYLIGESGGGYLSLATAMKARDEHIKAPAGIVPYSAAN